MHATLSLSAQAAEIATAKGGPPYAVWTTTKTTRNKRSLESIPGSSCQAEPAEVQDRQRRTTGQKHSTEQKHSTTQKRLVNIKSAGALLRLLSSV